MIGSPEIMHGRLLHVAEVSGRAYVSVQVVATAVSTTGGLSRDVGLTTVDGTADVLHTDAVPEGHPTESRSLVRAAAVAFERIQQHAMPHAQYAEMVLKVAEEKWNTYDDLRWRKSSFSGNGGNYVEVASNQPGIVAVPVTLRTSPAPHSTSLPGHGQRSSWPSSAAASLIF